MTVIFHDIMHHTIKDYVDDLVVKSRERNDHLKHLEAAFKRFRKFNMRMNPLKCTFGVASTKFLCFLVHTHGIDVDESKM